MGTTERSDGSKCTEPTEHTVRTDRTSGTECSTRTHGSRFGALATACVLSMAAAPSLATAEDDICKTWVREHCMAKAEYIRLYLDPSVSTERLDRRLYDMLQLESYLLSCNLPEQRLRRSLVGWRLVDKPADSFGQAVLASAYAEAGLELHPRSVFGSERYLLGE